MHTPGPWHGDIDQDGQWSVAYYPKETGGCLPILKTCKEPKKADKFLILAAPQLLEALEKITSYADDLEKAKQSLEVYSRSHKSIFHGHHVLLGAILEAMRKFAALTEGTNA